MNHQYSSKNVFARVLCLLTIGALVPLFSVANADVPQPPEKVSVGIKKAYIPAGFDSNDRTELVVEGSFPNSCYRVGPVEKKVNSSTGEVTIKQMAYRYSGVCLMMIVPFTQTIPLGILKANDYKVKDSTTGTELGDLPVQQTDSPNPDNYVYASVTDAVLVREAGVKKIAIQGQLPGTCWRLREIKAFQDGQNVIVVLPILEKVFSAAGCQDTMTPFVKTAEVPNVTEGRYLLHVRSQNGVAINKLVDL